ncbi:hypothetical protein PZ938_07655 [Luteipulveratus sp. YIM 133132]|uniref:hypothetical protein n=1 Tax=Luteipulveratus flavus TaxID=3031728 RepID=UPI0023B1245D|nr:hypothetical protein [Luteipulveratus sp. YIM 133132]MDE9365477.1 hypothetical protein [Luteipulveratus sp. YIM 133132]
MSVKSHRLGPGSLKFGETGSEVEFAMGCRKVTIEPDVEEGDSIPVLSGDEISEGDEETWKLTGEILQSYDLNGFILWCHKNAGATVPFIFRPDNDKAFAVVGDVKVRRVSIGGDVKARNTSEFEFKGEGEYDLVDPAQQTPLVFASGAAPAPPVVDATEWD